MREKIERQGVGLAVEIFEQGIVENLVVGGRGHEQGQAGSEFQIVRIREDLFSAAPVHVEGKLRTFSEPWTQDRVLQIGFGLFERGSGELLCCSTVTTPLICGKMNHIQ